MLPTRPPPGPRLCTCIGPRRPTPPPFLVSCVCQEMKATDEESGMPDGVGSEEAYRNSGLAVRHLGAKNHELETREAGM